MAHIYEVGTRAWQPDATEGWVASEVEQKLVDGDKVKLVFRLESGEVRPIYASLDSHGCLIHVRATGESNRDQCRNALKRSQWHITSSHESYDARSQR
ncbi:uncharacterized protein IWZ02DRAFT_272146 [Phyllosticta citriasiana]|uniref:uncharacterized protein n=1 Tax=Phyllosticta citriasiana TaxID=595635 RepID=UPI0030FD4D3C